MDEHDRSTLAARRLSLINCRPFRPPLDLAVRPDRRLGSFHERPYPHRMLAILIVEQGTIDWQERRIAAGEALLRIHPDPEDTGVGTASGWVVWASTWTPEGSDQSLPGSATDLVIRPADGITAQVRALLEEATAGRPHQRQAIACRLQLLLIELLRAAPAGETTPREAPLSAEQRSRLMALIADRPSAPPGVDELAAAFGYSPRWFARIVRRSYGMSLRTWITRQRMRVAADLLLRTDRPIGELARHLGYASVSTFARQFQRVYGRSPRAYRRAPDPG